MSATAICTQDTKSPLQQPTPWNVAVSKRYEDMTSYEAMHNTFECVVPVLQNYHHHIMIITIVAGNSLWHLQWWSGVLVAQELQPRAGNDPDAKGVRPLFKSKHKPDAHKGTYSNTIGRKTCKDQRLSLPGCVACPTAGERKKYRHFGSAYKGAGKMQKKGRNTKRNRIKPNDKQNDTYRQTHVMWAHTFTETYPETEGPQERGGGIGRDG